MWIAFLINAIYGYKMWNLDFRKTKISVKEN